jgi:hypothetical protein
MRVFTLGPELYGIAVKMINGTGAETVLGSVVTVSSTEDNKFALQTNEFDAIGVVAEVLFKNGEAATRGHVALSADTDGRARGIAVPSSNPVVAEHFKEIGHVLESKNAGTNILVKCILHFN